MKIKSNKKPRLAIAWLLAACMAILSTSNANAVKYGPWNDMPKDNLGLNPTLEIESVEVNVEISYEFSVKVTLAKSFPIVSNNTQMQLALETTGDNAVDFYTDVNYWNRMGSDGFYSADFDRTVYDITGEEQVLTNCLAKLLVYGETITFTIKDFSCLNPKRNNIGVRIVAGDNNVEVDAAPDDSVLYISTDLPKTYKCDKSQYQRPIDIAPLPRTERYFCLITSSPGKPVKWGLVEEDKASDALYLKPEACNSNSQNKVVKRERTYDSKSWICVKKSSKWVWTDLAAHTAKIRQDKISKAKYLPAKAYYACRLDDPFTSMGVELADQGKTLILKNAFTGPVSAEIYRCVVDYLKMPRSVQSKVESTRALDGTLEGKWGSLSAFWNFHPDDGLDITFTLN